MTTERTLVREAARRLSVKESADSDFEAKLERAEEAYEDLVRTRASLGTALAEAISRGRDLSEFGRRMEDLPILIRKADVRRTELKVELLSRRLKEAEAAHGRATEAASSALASLEEAKKSYAKVASVERRSALEAQRLKELRDEEAERLERLRSEERKPHEVATP
jgi:DNA repair ATPase RecN